MAGMKTCTTCKMEKPLSEFGKNRSVPGGHDRQCKECVKPLAKARMRKYHSTDKSRASIKSRGLLFRSRHLSGEMSVSKEKRCPSCGLIKTADQFMKNLSTKSGLSVWCKICAHEKHTAARKRNMQDPVWRAMQTERNRRHLAKPGVRDQHKAYQLKYMYGVAAVYDRLLASQNGGCAICRSNNDGRRLCVDHDHVTENVRGLLCSKCNMAIGLLRDSPDLIRRAATYLDYHKGGMV